MPQAAVPAYVGQDFSPCPPGHRFNLYFCAWDERWALEREGARAAALRDMRQPLPAPVAELLAALGRRQLLLARALPRQQCLLIEARSTSPLATGLGTEHSAGNGFSFLSPYGLPYLAGSGVKGVFRRAAEELLAEGEDGFEPYLPDVLFGTPQPGGEGRSAVLSEERGRRGALACWDVLPQVEAMALEVMTPHQGDYLLGTASPHDAGQPNPIRFLALPPGTAFCFVLVLDPGAVPGGCHAVLPKWQPLVRRIARHAFEWLGFGAKTAMGYGAMDSGETAPGTDSPCAGTDPVP